MHEPFRKYIDSYVTTPVPDTEFDTIQQLFTSKKLRRKQYLLQEGDICKHLSFIVKSGSSINVDGDYERKR